MDTNYRLLLDQYNRLKDEIDECAEYLNSLKVPTNGIDPEGNLGYGKRENLTLLQRIKFMKYEKS